MDLRAAAVIIAGSALLPFAACLMEDSVVCEAGDQKSCFCGVEGPRGYQTCSKDRSGYGACACQADMGDAGMEDSGPEGGLKMFMDLCSSSEECAMGLFCAEYSAKPWRCSRSCTSATSAVDCPPPSTGCNGMGICKSP